MTKFSDAEWDGSASRWPSTAAYCDDCMINENTGERANWVQSKCKLPYKEPGSGAVNLGALRAIASVLRGGRGGLSGVSSAAKAAAAKKLLALMKEAHIGEGAQ